MNFKLCTSEEDLGGISGTYGTAQTQQTPQANRDLKSLAVYGFSTHPCAVCYVATLNHEPCDDPVEMTALEVKGRPTIAIPALARAQATEIFDSFGCHILEQLEHYPSDVSSCSFPNKIPRIRAGLYFERLSKPAAGTRHA